MEQNPALQVRLFQEGVFTLLQKGQMVWVEQLEDLKAHLSCNICALTPSLHSGLSWRPPFWFLVKLYLL